MCSRLGILLQFIEIIEINIKQWVVDKTIVIHQSYKEDANKHDSKKFSHNSCI